MVDGPPAWGMENIIAALEHRDRISRISIDHPSSLILETLLPVMQEPFPALKFLDLDTRGSIPDLFLGGSAPDLRHLYLEVIPFPTLPTLLLSATGLVTLSLRNVPHSGYISRIDGRLPLPVDQIRKACAQIPIHSISP